MHSPWGLIDQICEKKGWTLDYVLESISWTNIQMMAADKIQLVKSSEIVHKVSKENIKQHRERYNG
ncbi:hypothetical protein [Sphingobacterium hotanense]|uniref:Uncharacterized protein n=1 Tax=Sphingobacterium hotanense TaxID=649196 RepID=A0ABT7NLI6_9SPHI|nr:hypothetical protein [Sphingobacterium hotanense]MDM1048062.1 hypothetical protein [Sphingobacterium hotanense]